VTSLWEAKWSRLQGHSRRRFLARAGTLVGTGAIARCLFRATRHALGDWLGWLQRIAPAAVVLTHAHSDHAAGLAAGAPCPVYATKETWDLIHPFPIRDRHRLSLTKSLTIDEVRFKAFPVEHSIRAPASIDNFLFLNQNSRLSLISCIFLSSMEWRAI
jgi:glyoxylase-like metal-dependent hydrolase (beta-lactamase superfamily II)